MTKPNSLKRLIWIFCLVAWGLMTHATISFAARTKTEDAACKWSLNLPKKWPKKLSPELREFFFNRENAKTSPAPLVTLAVEFEKNHKKTGPEALHDLAYELQKVEPNGFYWSGVVVADEFANSENTAASGRSMIICDHQFIAKVLVPNIHMIKNVELLGFTPTPTEATVKSPARAPTKTLAKESAKESEKQKRLIKRSPKRFIRQKKQKNVFQRFLLKPKFERSVINAIEALRYPSVSAAAEDLFQKGLRELILRGEKFLRPSPENKKAMEGLLYAKGNGQKLKTIPLTIDYYTHRDLVEFATKAEKFYKRPLSPSQMASFLIRLGLRASRAGSGLR